MPSSTPSELMHRQRRIARPWRICFVAYALALTTGTHWPNLELGPEVPASDKTIHLLAFGSLTILLWQTRWIRSLWLLWLIALAWALADETSQGIPGLNRTVSRFDYLADALGVTTAAMFIWCLKPVGDAANRARIRSMGFVLDEMFSRSGPWIAASAITFACGLAAIVIDRRVQPETGRVVIIAAVCFAAVAIFIIWWRQWSVTFNMARQRKPCLMCGEAARADASGVASDSCAACGEPAYLWTWSLEGGPSTRRMVMMGRRPALLALAALILGFGFIFATPLLYDWLVLHRSQSGGGGTIAPRLASMINTIPPEMSNVIDLAALLFLLAVVIRLYRSSLAKFYDRHVRCQACGHDLRDTPVGRSGSGRCGECGAAFERP